VHRDVRGLLPVERGRDLARGPGLVHVRAARAARAVREALRG
jgi:hypothetical protein